MTDFKKAVLICPDFFDYKKLIEAELQNIFFSIISYSDRPACSSVSKAFIKYNVFGYRSLFSKLYSKQLFNSLLPIIEDISVLIVIKGTCIDRLLFELVKKKNPLVRIIAYSWDSIVNAKGFVNLAKSADRALSFDIEDCVSFNFDYLPLFFSKNDIETNIVDFNKDIKFSFIGSYHGDRLKLLSKFIRNNKIYNSDVFFRVYFQSKIQFLFFYLLDPFLRDCPKEWITFDVINRTQMNNVLARSKFVIDIHHKGQSGLTMRTWEVLSLNYLLLTTNPYILMHQLIEDVDILDRETAELWDLEKKTEFLKKYSLDEKVSLNTLSLTLWLDELLK